MSMENYELGDMNNDLFLKMNVGTAGIAVSIVYYKDGMSNPTIAESGTNSGNIEEVTIGKVNDNRNKVLHFSTDIDLTPLDPKNWEQETKILVITFEIRGGKNGKKEFKMNSNDLKKVDNGKTLLFNKYIQLS